MQVENDATRQKKLREKEKKLQKVEKQQKSHQDEKSEERNQKRFTKTTEFNKRMLNLSKEFENNVSQEIQR